MTVGGQENCPRLVLLPVPGSRRTIKQMLKEEKDMVYFDRKHSIPKRERDGVHSYSFSVQPK